MIGELEKPDVIEFSGAWQVLLPGVSEGEVVDKVVLAGGTAKTGAQVDGGVDGGRFRVSRYPAIQGLGF